MGSTFYKSICFFFFLFFWVSKQKLIITRILEDQPIANSNIYIIYISQPIARHWWLLLASLKGQKVWSWSFSRNQETSPRTCQFFGWFKKLKLAFESYPHHHHPNHLTNPQILTKVRAIPSVTRQRECRYF